MRRAAAVLVLALVIPAAAQDDAPDAAALAAKERAALSIPDDVWEQVLAAGGRPGGVLGYTHDEMLQYGGREHLLRSVENLFRDVRAIPRDTGRITDGLIESGLRGEIDVLLQRCWGLLDLPAGRMFPRVPRDGWGVEHIPPTATPAEALARLADGPRWEPVKKWYATVGNSDLAALPAPVRRLFVRLAIGAHEATAWMLETVDVEGLRILPHTDMFDSARWDATGPWRDDEYAQSATRSHHAFEWLRDKDHARAAYASVIFAAHLRTALEEWRAAAPVDSPEGLWWLLTPLGKVVVAGSGDDELIADDLDGAWCVLDLGGADTWKGAFGSSGRNTVAPLAVAIDLGGDDTWDADGENFALGCGALGLGVVVDLDGNDRYVVENSGLGCGWFGTGLLWDLAGDDEYVVRGAWGQGAAHAGVGVLLDTSGNDRYECAEQSMGLGSTLGTGLLLDLDGDDVYWCRDDGNVSELYLGQSVAMAQGCGYGRRADLGDGRSLAGGWGLLVDLAGDDHYHAQCWAQGAGYWWGVGVLDDRGGNDVYENGKYSLGAAAHFAIGVHVDVAGDDRYNQGVEGAKNQFHGHARDGSIGVAIDGGGNDRYFLKNLCAGGADLASIALFWDRSGDDVYETALDADSRWARPPFGAATWYDPMRSYRDDLISWGVFLDTGGVDTYPDGGRAKNAATWRDDGAPNSRGFGLDRD